MYYYIYKITNLINQKIYIGVHKTSSLDDGYMGSGKIITAAIKKYGLENFQKDILEFFNSSNEMYIREKEIVTDDFLLREDVYNLRRGGFGGFDYINNNDEIKKPAVKKGGKITGPKNGKISQSKLTFEERSRRSKKAVETKKKNGTYDQQQNKFREASLTESCKQKRKETLKKQKHQQGEKNSQFGKMWISNIELRECKTIKNTDIIPEGWIKGRVLDFDKEEKQKIKEENKIKKSQEVLQQKIIFQEYLFSIYSEYGFKEFVKITKYDKSISNLLQGFKKYVKNYNPKKYK